MEDAGPPAAGAATRGGWRSQIDFMARQVMVKQIFKTLRWHLPLSDEEGHSRLQKIAGGFECKFYTEATSKDSYKRKIAMLLIYVENMNQNSHRQENGADDKGKAPMSESPGDDEVIPLPQESSDSTLYATSNEDLTYEPTDDGAINLKKRKIDSSSSWALPMDDPWSFLAIPDASSISPPLGQLTFSVREDDPSYFLEIPEASSSSWAPLHGQPTSSVPVDDPSSFVDIPEASSSVPSWVNQLQFQDFGCMTIDMDG